jgi:heme-degrading monooxygenase HmoA
MPVFTTALFETTGRLKMIIAVFRSTVAPRHQAEFATRYAEMSKLVAKIPGYRGHQNLFDEEKQENVVIVEFETEEAFDAWDRHPEHKKAKMLGKEYIFDAYDVSVGRVFERHTKP